MSQGQNKQGTPRKQAGFAMVLRQNLKITKSKTLGDYPYWHLDCNAGCGYNHVADCPGSPLVFLEQAERVGREFRAFFCDNDPEAMEQLRAATLFAVERTLSSAIRGVCCDNAVAVKLFSDWIAEDEGRPELAIGSIIVDPNGHPNGPARERHRKRVGYPGDTLLAALKGFLDSHRRIDLILNLNISLFARARKCKDNPNTPGFDDWEDPEDVLGLKPLKAHWLVRNPSRGGKGDRFVMFIGRNTSIGMKGFEEFYPIDSHRGQLILKNLTRVEPEQGWLFD